MWMCVRASAFWGMLMCALEVAPETLAANTNTTEGPNLRPQDNADGKGLYTALEIIKGQTFSSFIVH